MDQSPVIGKLYSLQAKKKFSFRARVDRTLNIIVYIVNIDSFPRARGPDEKSGQLVAPISVPSARAWTGQQKSPLLRGLVCVWVPMIKCSPANSRGASRESAF